MAADHYLGRELETPRCWEEKGRVVRTPGRLSKAGSSPDLKPSGGDARTAPAGRRWRVHTSRSSGATASLGAPATRSRPRQLPATSPQGNACSSERSNRPGLLAG